MALLVCIAFGSVPARLNGLSITDTDPVDYLIIAPNDAAMIREIVPLAEKKTEKGLSARILTVDSIGASYPGRDIAEKMRTAIREFRQNRQTQYVLLAGDLDLVPSRQVRMSRSDSAFFTDAYYECLDGTWDENGDGVFANEGREIIYEPQCHTDSLGHYTCEIVEVRKGNDFDPDVIVGRLPFSNAQEGAVMIGKTMQYQYDPPLENFNSRMLFLGHRMFSQANAPMDDGSQYMRRIRSAYDSTGSDFDGAGFREVYEDRILSNDSIVQDSLYHTPEEYIDYLNQGNNLVFWIGHGSPTLIEVAYKYRAFFQLDHVPLLKGQPANFFTISCAVMQFENGKSIAKSILAQPVGGAVTFTGASGVEYVNGKALLLRKAAETMSYKGTRCIAKALLSAARDLGLPYDLLVYQFWGDPELSAWNRPLTGANKFTIEAQRKGGRIRVQVSPLLDSTLVCLYKPGAVFVRGYALAGLIEFLDTLIGIDSIRITASAHDYIQTTALLVGGSARITSAAPRRVVAVRPAQPLEADVFGRAIAPAMSRRTAHGVYFTMERHGNNARAQTRIHIRGLP